MKKYWNVFLLVALMALSACTINNPSTSSTSNNDNTSQISTSNSEETSTSESTSSTTTSEVDEVEAYYQDVDTSLSGEAFLKELQDLNAKMRVRTVGYSNMGSYFLKTDGDPDNPGNLIGFYSGDSAYFSGSWTTFNREHVWPNSRGGSAVENDIHVIRPTIQSQNGDRGNSFFVEGKSSSKGGWDPAMESWGDEKYRGIVARIVFYCVVANPNFELVDKDNVYWNGTILILSIGQKRKEMMLLKIFKVTAIHLSIIQNGLIKFGANIYKIIIRRLCLLFNWC